jgi:hypothetical protein
MPMSKCADVQIELRLDQINFVFVNFFPCAGFPLKNNSTSISNPVGLLDFGNRPEFHKYAFYVQRRRTINRIEHYFDQGRINKPLLCRRGSINMAAISLPDVRDAVPSDLRPGLYFDQGRNKKTPSLQKGFNKYGSYLLSRIVVQYHRP